MSVIEDSKVSLKTLVLIVLGAISLTGTVSSVYHGIVYNSARVEYVNDRIDTKTKRIEGELKDLREMVIELQKSGSDGTD